MLIVNVVNIEKREHIVTFNDKAVNFVDKVMLFVDKLIFFVDIATEFVDKMLFAHYKEIKKADSKSHRPLESA
ncbi:hypothetical protein ACFVR2_15215 [Gottfriedia sp. NPDC057991]|uniref:hypothetical protein n=1 Tax=Gottfriedia sp. NPDC057991 TaxID=3346298 RepID=UPI0036D841F7